MTDPACEEKLYQAIALVRPIHLNVHRAVERQLATAGISVAERAVLELLCAAPMTVPQAAGKLSLKRQFVQRIVASLVKAGLLEKRRNPEHRSAYLCAPTATGRACFEKIHRGELDILRNHLGDISDADATAALRVMRRIAEVFEEQAHDNKEQS